MLYLIKLHVTFCYEYTLYSPVEFNYASVISLIMLGGS